MTEFELQILDIVQDGFPIVERPYAAIAEIYRDRYGHTPSSVQSLACHSERSVSEVEESCFAEQQVFEAVENLRNEGVIRRLGGVYDTKRLGLVSRLCAGKVPSVATGAADDSALDQFAATVMDIPAITHNYVRSHEYNVWFTIIAESETALQSVIEKLCAETALHDAHAMPALKMFKINTVMSVFEGRKANVQNEPSVIQSGTKNLESLSEFDKARIRLLSGNIPHSLTPFTDLFHSVIQSGAKTLEEVLVSANEDLTSKRMRRFGAVLRHQNAGFPCNAMVCFDAGENAADAGAKLAANPHVSHCYERPAFEGFSYNVYGMFHASCDEELSQFIGEAAETLGNQRFAVLHSLRELKKTSYQYFAG